MTSRVLNNCLISEQTWTNSIKLSERAITKHKVSEKAQLNTIIIIIPVSYTHLDVYKRQVCIYACLSVKFNFLVLLYSNYFRYYSYFIDTFYTCE